MDDPEYEDHYDEMHRSNSMGAFLAGLLIGALAGAAAMLLTVPQSGERTRQQIREKTMELRDQAAGKAGDVRAKARDVTEDLRGRMEDLQMRGQEKLEEQRNRVSEAVEAGKQAVRRR